jgi:hypothetical protein
MQEPVSYYCYDPDIDTLIVDESIDLVLVCRFRTTCLTSHGNVRVFNKNELSIIDEIISTASSESIDFYRVNRVGD